MRLFCLCIFGFAAICLFGLSEAWTGHFAYRSVLVYYRTEHPCTKRVWGVCWSHGTYHVPVYQRRAYCLFGWTHNGNEDCSIPVCNPRCMNGGTCYAPNRCRCRNGYEGDICGGVSACSHLNPCYPGRCYGHQCACSEGFGGAGCIELQSNRFLPTVEKINATFTYHQETTNKDVYQYMEDATNKPNGESIWTNQGKFNAFEFYIEASVDTKYVFSNIPPIPGNYIREAKFGIVSAKADVIHQKLQNNSHIDATRKSYTCPRVSSTHPLQNEALKCHIKDSYNIQFDSGDKYIIHFQITNGGYRILTNSGSYYSQNIYTGMDTTSSIKLLFDYDDPVHCIESNTCGSLKTPFNLTEDITKSALRPYWYGWSDKLSGVERYVYEVWKMEYSKDNDGLREPLINRTFNPVPLFIQEISATSSQFPTYEPSGPGVYSAILEVNDKANNSKYARQIAIFDKTSDISISTDFSLYVSSASPSTNYTWQSDQFAKINVTWNKHFINKLHENEHFLARILDYAPRLDDGKSGRRHDYKKILPQFDDKDGARNISAIPNIYSIVRFDTAFGLTNLTTPSSEWTVVSPLRDQKRFQLIDIRDGDSRQVWVRAYDIMGNTKVDSTVVHFDRSPPKIYPSSKFIHNVDDGIYPFSSRVLVSAEDQHSGVRKVSVRFIVNGTKEVKAEQDFMIDTVPKEKCEFFPADCYCVKMGECFSRNTALDINNCWLKVPIDQVADFALLMETTVYNSAMLSEKKYEKIGMINQLNGIRQYFSPKNVTITKRTDTSIAFSWNQAPTCYERVGITIHLYTPDNKSIEFNVSKDQTSFIIDQLSPVTQYSFEMYTKYGNSTSFVRSADPAFLKFETAETEKGFPLSGVFGIITGFIVLLVLVALVLVYLGRTGRLQPARERVSAGIRTIRNTIRVRSYGGGYNNRAYSSKEDDDIYFYGGMDMTTCGSLAISRKDISLESELARGRFAVIFLAKYYTKKEERTVVAKTLKDDQNQECIMKMKAKINFYATKVGHHKNILDFVGNVDDDVRGPIMILEYCSKGVLKDFLVNIRSNLTVDIEERLFRMVFGICLGMDYLASQKVVHRRLAARNILLNDLYEPKITGFGPDPSTEQDVEDKADNERIPIKWVAPECMKSTQNANELSDVWSFAIVMWEVFSLGETPYPALQSREVPARVKQGYKMAKPEYCDDAFYKVMLKCWHYDQKKRPGFSKLKDEMNNMFTEAPGDDYYYRTNEF